MNQALSVRQFLTLKVLAWSGLVAKQGPLLHSLESSRTWWPIVREPYAGAWQSNVSISLDTVLTHPTVFACVTLIAFDIGKLRLRLVEQIDEARDIWREVENPAFSPVLRKPNRYQTRQQFIETWLISKLVHGNTYVLKIHDARRVVIGLSVLDPNRVRVLVADNGDVFYELKKDLLSRQPDAVVTVPSTEVMHDVYAGIYHPLVGVSPIHACGLAATQGISIANNETLFFENGGRPGGVLSAPGHIADDTAARLKAYFDDNFSGENAGKVAVLGDGLKYEPMAFTARESQVIQQLGWADEKICSAYHVPGFMVGVGPAPSYNNIQALNLGYYTKTLQNPIEKIETLLDEGLGLAGARFGPQQRRTGVEFDLTGLLRMDSETLLRVEQAGVGSGIKSPNEARAALNLPPVTGGDSPMLQQQVFSLEALAERDAAEPFAKPVPSPPARTPGEQEEETDEDRETAKAWIIRRALERARRAA